MTKKIAAALAALLALASGPAHAGLYDWTVDLPINGGGSIIGSGTLTTQDTQTNGGYLVTAISGTYGAATIIKLLGVGTRGGNDNLVFPNASPLLDYNGITFAVSQDPGAGEGTSVNLFYGAPSGYSDLGNTRFSTTAFTLTAAPEPSSLALIAAGLAGLAFTRRRSAPHA